MHKKLINHNLLKTERKIIECGIENALLKQIFLNYFMISHIS